MTRISEFLKVAEVKQEPGFLKKILSPHLNLMVFNFLQQVGIDRGDIPDLSQVSLDDRSKDYYLDSLQLRWRTCSPNLFTCFA